jgi:hypothetical protein
MAVARHMRGRRLDAKNAQQQTAARNMIGAGADVNGRAVVAIAQHPPAQNCRGQRVGGLILDDDPRVGHAVAQQLLAHHRRLGRAVAPHPARHQVDRRFQARAEAMGTPDTAAQRPARPAIRPDRGPEDHKDVRHGRAPWPAISRQTSSFDTPIL